MSSKMQNDHDRIDYKDNIFGVYGEGGKCLGGGWQTSACFSLLKCQSHTNSLRHTHIEHVGAWIKQQTKALNCHFCTKNIHNKKARMARTVVLR